MSFNLSTYQPHLAEAGLDVYQTYYLNAKDKAMWTDGQVAEDKVRLGFAGRGGGPVGPASFQLNSRVGERGWCVSVRFRGSWTHGAHSG